VKTKAIGLSTRKIRSQTVEHAVDHMLNAHLQQARVQKTTRFPGPRRASANQQDYDSRSASAPSQTSVMYSSAHTSNETHIRNWTDRDPR